MSMKEIISNNFNININKEDLCPPSYVTKELISNSFSININKLEDIPPTVVEKEVISNSFNININKTSIPIDIPVESISVNPNLKDVFVGDVFQIGYTITPSNATNKDVVFSSNNRSVATVNANTGVVEAKGVGECNITCTTVDGNKSDICTVTVREKAPEKIPVQSVSITPKQLNLTVGEFHTFSYIIVPENATNKSVVFVSDNIEIATINGNTVTAVTEGSCKVYVRTLDGNKEDVCDLTVISNEIEGENTPPILSVVFVSSERPDGSYVLNYSVINKDQDEITHKLKIDNSEFTTINPNQDGIYCTYNGTGLTAGEHTGYIQISDGENTVTSKKFIINIPIETESIKEQLKLAKDNYDIKHDNLKNVINSIIEDRVFDEEAEGYILDNAFNEYNIALAKHREISQKAIDSIANKKSHDLKDKFNKDIIDINFAVNGLENTMNGAFKDGILTESEKLSIKQHLLILSSEKSDIDKQYETMFANEHLEGQPKTDLSTAYNSYVLAYNSLVTVINNILEKGGLIDSTDRNKLNNAFKEHDSKLGLYSTNATNALDAIAKKKAEVESAKVDKKYADIILDPETGIVSKVEHINQEINGEEGLIKRISLAEQKITSDAIVNTVKKHTTNGSATFVQNSVFEQTVNGINSTVSKKTDKTSIISTINQSAESVVINANKIKLEGTTTVGGQGRHIRIKENDICMYENATEYAQDLKLEIGFQENELDTGTYVPKIRMGCYGMNPDAGSINEGNYVLIHHMPQGANPHDSNTDAFAITHRNKLTKNWNGYRSFGNGRVSLISLDNTVDLRAKDGIRLQSNTYYEYLSGTRIYAENISVGSLIYSDTVNCRAFGSNGGAILMHGNLDGNNKNLGWSESKFNQVSAKAIWGDTGSWSDKRTKENIRYLDNENVVDTKYSNDNITKLELFEFIKTLKICEYNYKEEFKSYQNDKIGFIANDVIGDKVGDKIVTEHEGYLTYNLNNMLFTTIGALQEEIKIREEENKQLRERLDNIEKILSDKK